MRNLFNGVVLACLLSLNGCIGLIAAQQLSADQIAAMRDYNGDVYACALIEGGTRNGNLTLIALPKDTPAEISFSQDCHAVVKTLQPNTIRGK